MITWQRYPSVVGAVGDPEQLGCSSTDSGRNRRRFTEGGPWSCGLTDRGGTARREGRAFRLVVFGRRGQQATHERSFVDVHPCHETSQIRGRGPDASPPRQPEALEVAHSSW